MSDITDALYVPYHKQGRVIKFVFGEGDWSMDAFVGEHKFGTTQFSTPEDTDTRRLEIRAFREKVRYAAAHLSSDALLRTACGSKQVVRIDRKARDWVVALRDNRPYYVADSVLSTVERPSRRVFRYDYRLSDAGLRLFEEVL